MSDFPGESPARAASQKPALEPTPACVGADEGRPPAPPAPALSLEDIENARRPQVDASEEVLQAEYSAGKRQDSQEGQDGQGARICGEDEHWAHDAAPDGKRIASERGVSVRDSAGNRRRIVLVVVVALALALAGGAFAVMQGSTSLRGEEFAPDAPESDAPMGEDAEQDRQETSVQKAVDQAFGSLAINEDAAFEACLQRFLDTYDKSLATAPAAQRASYGFADLDITASELTPLLLSGFSCGVKQVDVYDNTAWITLEVTSRSLLEQADVFSRAARLADEDFSEATEATYKQDLKQAYLDAFDGLPARTGQVLVTMPCGGDAWDVPQQVLDQVLAAAWCGNLSS